MDTKTKLLALGCALLLGGGAAFFPACGGGDTSNGDAGDATTGNDVSNPQQDSAVEAASDAGADVTSGACVPVEGGLACDPAHITCGAKMCDAGTQFCCITDGGAKLVCDNLTADGGIPTNVCAGSTKATCDEAANCPQGQVCCGFVGSSGGFSTSCQTSCGTGLQFCRGSAECKSGQCTVQQCRGVTIETCGSLCP